MNKTFSSRKNNSFIAATPRVTNTMFMEKFGERLRARIGDLQISEAEAARKIGISARRFSYYLNNEREPDYDLLLKICKVFKITPDYLFGYAAEPHLGNTPDLPIPVNDRDAIQIPEYDVRAAMGDGFVVDQETIRDRWTFSRRYLTEELRLGTRNLVVLELIGDSMAPTLLSGDRALVDMSDRRVGIPGIFALWDGDGTVAKRVERIPNTAPQRIKLISDNPLHSTYEVLAEDTNIIGRLVWFARRL